MAGEREERVGVDGELGLYAPRRSPEGHGVQRAEDPGRTAVQNVGADLGRADGTVAREFLDTSDVGYRNHQGHWVWPLHTELPSFRPATRACASRNRPNRPEYGDKSHERDRSPALATPLTTVFPVSHPTWRSQMRVKVLKLGSSAHEVDATPGSTVQEVLDKASLPHGGHAISVNGLGAGLSTALGEGDIVTLVPKVEGGR